jgi:hypothetical protein
VLRHVNASRAQCAPKARFSATGRPAWFCCQVFLCYRYATAMLITEPARPDNAAAWPRNNVASITGSQRWASHVASPLDGNMRPNPINIRSRRLPKMRAESLVATPHCLPSFRRLCSSKAAACLIWLCRGLFLIVLEIAADRGQGCGGGYPPCLGQPACSMRSWRA